ncbi:MAG: hypothetical protein M1837_006024 [Sclerophora amabilis]|nr:MAG: hypothetical protein M1837_006024 [Sclerophora amabilis]
MADEPRSSKRSRFDQSEPRPRQGSHEEGKRQSRFDRRSRSPSSRSGNTRRSRSPLNRDTFSPGSEEKKRSGLDPAAAAAAAAAKIGAQIQAKKGVQHVDVPPIRSAASPAGKSSSPPVMSSNINGDIYVADGDYIKDIEVNDLRNRYTLTKGPTQKMIKEETGAGTLYLIPSEFIQNHVTTRGSYLPDKSMATPSNPPLYLHITSTNKEGLEKAILKVEELMKQELPNLVDERRFRRREPEQVERDEYGRRKWPEERIPISLEPIPGFNLRAQVVGHGGAYVKHIQQETRCRVQIKGRGSGFLEHGSGQESDEDMFLHVALMDKLLNSGPDPREVQRAKELCEDLLSNVKEQYDRFKENPPQQNYGGYGHSGGYQQRNQDRNQYSGYGGYGGYGGQSNSPAPPSSAMSPTGHGPPGTPGAQGAQGAPGAAGSDYAAQYAQYYGGADPYAAYGGYANYVSMYQQWVQQGQQPQQAPGAAPSDPSIAPPPPPSGTPPPPPPSGSPPGGGYNSVPPPPGM